jgi:undecaprenyl-diphosphatase
MASSDERCRPASILQGLWRSLRDREIRADDTDAKLGWLIVVATIPAGLLGLTLEHPLRRLFASPQSAAAFLAANGLLLYGAERLRRRAPVRSEAGIHSDAVIARTLDFRQSLAVGAAQALALIPGLSRSGASMGGGLLVGMSNEEDARFAFLLATPIIGAAGVLKLPDLLGSQGDNVRGQAVVGAACAAVTAYFSVRFLLRYFETNRLTPFAIYCLVIGAALSVGFALA